MNPGTCGDVSAYDLIRIPQVWHVLLGRMLPRNPNYVIVGKRYIRHLDAGCGQKIVQFFGFCNYPSLRPVAPLRQISPHGVDAEFGQTPFRSVRLDTLPF